ncbi:TetR/AcrR family transcriptional regulator [Nocardioides sp. W7]|uniref:TetR/AcrR family transcriptional regulator n=1 Tax=Nocardioides sp. W7 TaxID=2931390 RepID=UPI001FD2420F|nr:TetR/AcrR family transcriptional regulator [Nocardioides sp. W7]
MTSSGTTARARRGRPGHDQAAVLSTAIDLFIRQGYDATSMADLAAALGLSKSSLYHHVPSKERLLELALDEALGELTEVVDAATADGAAGSPYERLRQVVEDGVRLLVAHQPAVTLLLRVHGNTEVERAALERRRWVDDRLAGLVRAAAEEGALRGDLDPGVVSRLLFGMVNSLVEWYDADGPVDVDSLARTVVAAGLDGLRA